MTEFVSILGCLKTDTDDVNAEDESLKNGDGEEELEEKEEQEVEEIVEDFMAMQNKEILRRDLKRMARDNVLLRRKIARYRMEAGSSRCQGSAPPRLILFLEDEALWFS